MAKEKPEPRGDSFEVAINKAAVETGAPTTTPAGDKAAIVAAVKAILADTNGGGWARAYEKAVELGYKSKAASLRPYVFPPKKKDAAGKAKKSKATPMATHISTVPTPAPTPAARPVSVEDGFKALIRQTVKETLLELIAKM